MSNITRRNVLTGIAGCSLAAALGGCNSEANKNSAKDQSIAKGEAKDPTHLNVFIHGLSVLYVNDGSSGGASKGINLYMPLIQVAAKPAPPPPDDDHRYFFGNIQDVPGQKTALLKSIGPNDVCTLSGVTATARPDESFFKADLLFPKATINSPASMRQFVLPWTTSIQSVALMKSKTSGKDLLDDNRPRPAHDYSHVKQLSTICILTYVISGQPTITYADGTDSGWSFQPSAPGSDYANLHIFAEPKQGSMGHALNAFDTLMGTINQTLLKFKPFPEGLDKIPDNTIPGAAAIDLLQLADLFKGGELANCVRAVVIA
jgi:hypothetical protein